MLFSNPCLYSLTGEPVKKNSKFYDRYELHGKTFAPSFVGFCKNCEKAGRSHFGNQKLCQMSFRVVYMVKKQVPEASDVECCQVTEGLQAVPKMMYVDREHALVYIQAPTASQDTKVIKISCPDVVKIRFREHNINKMFMKLGDYKAPCEVWFSSEDDSQLYLAYIRQFLSSRAVGIEHLSLAVTITGNTGCEKVKHAIGKPVPITLLPTLIPHTELEVYNLELKSFEPPSNALLMPHYAMSPSYSPQQERTREGEREEGGADSACEEEGYPRDGGGSASASRGVHQEAASDGRARAERRGGGGGSIRIHGQGGDGVPRRGRKSIRSMRSTEAQPVFLLEKTAQDWKLSNFSSEELAKARNMLTREVDLLLDQQHGQVEVGERARSVRSARSTSHAYQKALNSLTLNIQYDRWIEVQQPKQLEIPTDGFSVEQHLRAYKKLRGLPMEAGLTHEQTADAIEKKCAFIEFSNQLSEIEAIKEQEKELRQEMFGEFIKGLGGEKLGADQLREFEVRFARKIEQDRVMKLDDTEKEQYLRILHGFKNSLADKDRRRKNGKKITDCFLAHPIGLPLPPEVQKRC
ncbi:hypothetical protein GUITHDRAFT_142502 [Guillardia theta CCMP2712]|uniref:Uncharacterized protein n=1 Tax=Guillardia theta (strain CCMP2712) TaxID=905079 RepID=L1IXE3_GUITC|nr:hypothetical protein GUITHDRAFT_142502 [Guillardia theta CCMP2712]EKX40891.1 hypothetical protein GUITHDRAFT_142502 [Guillardia theta CCMP2712]|eukprot:XP_005827871.1 hypothetical protein GUITHDRAFT_142502 [Guillardia theta CCMP2712]